MDNGNYNKVLSSSNNAPNIILPTEGSINNFALDSMSSNPSIGIIAKRGSGKSWKIGTIIKHFENIPLKIIFSSREQDNPYYSVHFPDACIYYKYDNLIIEKLLRRQELVLQKIREQEDNANINPSVLVVFDDCFANGGILTKDPLIYDLLLNGRHKHITYILAMQCPLVIEKKIRLNFDYVFLLAEDFIPNQKTVYKHYAGMFPNFNSFKQVFCQLTENYGAMVIKNRCDATILFDRIAYYETPENFDEIIKSYIGKKISDDEILEIDKDVFFEFRSTKS